MCTPKLLMNAAHGLGDHLQGGVDTLTGKVNIPAPIAPTAPPQATKAPNVQGIIKANMGMGQAGGSPGVASTFLTGAAGVNPNSLLLGRNTLLGA